MMKWIFELGNEVIIYEGRLVISAGVAQWRTCVKHGL
jgi:hypothetical protein